MNDLIQIQEAFGGLVAAVAEEHGEPGLIFEARPFRHERHWGATWIIRDQNYGFKIAYRGSGLTEVTVRSGTGDIAHASMILRTPAALDHRTRTLLMNILTSAALGPQQNTVPSGSRQEPAV